MNVLYLRHCSRKYLKAQILEAQPILKLYKSGDGGIFGAWRFSFRSVGLVRWVPQGAGEDCVLISFPSSN